MSHASSTHPIPLFPKVAAGFPSPAEDYAERALDLNELCVHNPTATFFVRVAGESMIEASLFPGDVLVVDKSLEAVSGNIVIAVCDGDFTVKRFVKRDGAYWLVPENKNMSPVRMQGEMAIWGVVTFVIHAVN